MLTSLDLNFFRRKRFLEMVKTQEGKIILTTNEFGWYLDLDETLVNILIIL